MDYQRIYIEFIADRKRRAASLVGYSEKHHILPRCLGGGEQSENIVRLTAGDHFFAHLLLAKIHGGPLWYAINALIAGQRIGDRKADRRFMLRARRYYEQARKGFAEAHSAKMKGVFAGSAHPMYGKPCSPVALAKLKARLADGFNPMSTPEARAKVGAAHRGKVLSEKTRRLIGASRIGVPVPPDVRAKMSATHKGKKLKPETIAKLIAVNTGKKRTPEQVAAMRKRLTGRKLSQEHVAKLLPHLAGLSRFRGKKHSQETRARMAAVCEARREYVARFGGGMRKLTIPVMREAGINI